MHEGAHLLHPAMLPRVPRYVAGYQDALVNCLLLLDGFWVRELKDETPIHLFPHTEIDLKPLMEEC